jgi:hypothetical protein
LKFLITSSLKLRFHGQCCLLHSGFMLLWSAPREMTSLHAIWSHTTWHGEIMSHQVTWRHSTFHDITPREMNLYYVSLSPRYMAAQYVKLKAKITKNNFIDQNMTTNFVRYVPIILWYQSKCSTDALHKGRPQNLTNFRHPPPASTKYGILQAKLTVASGFNRHPSPAIRKSFMDHEPLRNLAENQVFINSLILN